MMPMPMRIPEPALDLEHQTVLVVEDETFVALYLESILTDAGATVMTPASSVTKAFDRVEEQRPDVAILDVNLQDGLVFPFARHLIEIKVPFVFVTAHARNDSVFADEFSSRPRLNKPVDENALLATLLELLGEGR